MLDSCANGASCTRSTRTSTKSSSPTANRRLLDVQRLSHDPATGLHHALFLTRLAKRFLIPAMAQITDPEPLPGSRLRTASRAYQTAIDDLARRAHLAA